MADTTAEANLTPQQWDAKYFREYLEKNRFSKEMGTGTNNVIQVKEDLVKKKGDKVTFALVNRLSGAGVTGNATLEGNEEAMSQRSATVTIERFRNGVRSDDWDEQLSAIPLRQAARDTLMDWSMEKLRDHVIVALGGINRVAYASATETQKDAWLVDNADRVLFGAAKGNNAANDHSAGLAAIDNTADKFGPDALSLMKRMALEASPKIRPIRTTEDRRMYVVYAGTRTFRDMRSNSAFTQAQREVSWLQQNQKLFQSGDLLWDDCIIKEIPDLPIYTGVGAGSIDVAPVYLCGAQAIGFAWAKRWKTAAETFDYGSKKGVAVDGMYKADKLLFGSGTNDTDDLQDHGVVTGYFAAVADA